MPTLSTADLTALPSHSQLLTAFDSPGLFSTAREQGTAFYLSTANPPGIVLVGAGHVAAAFASRTGIGHAYSYQVTDPTGPTTTTVTLAGIAPQTDIAAYSVGPTSAAVARGALRKLPLSARPPKAGEAAWALCAVGPQAVVPLKVVSPSALLIESDTATGKTLYSIPNAIRLSGESHPGCSGGPVLDGTGSVIGVLVAAGGTESYAVAAADLREWLRSAGYDVR